MTELITNRTERSRFLRFAVVGFTGAIVDFGVMNLMRDVCSLGLVLSGAISFIAAIINNFIWNRYWTYPDSRSKHFLHQLIQFSLVSVTGLLIRIPILKYLEPVVARFIQWLPFRIPFFSPASLSANITLTIAIVIVMFWNFFTNRYWTYNDVQ